MTEHFSYAQEVRRKLIHLSSLWMAATAMVLDRSACLILLAVAAVVVLAYEILRRRATPLSPWLNAAFGAALRPEEQTVAFRPTGAVYVVAGAFFSVLLFSKAVAGAALTQALTGDAAAALVGRKYGKIKILGKTLEGALAFFAVAFLTGALVLTPFFLGEDVAARAAAGACAAALAELTARKIRMDDNLVVPLAAGAAMTLWEWL